MPNEEQMAALQEAVEATRKDYRKRARALSRARVKAAAVLDKAVMKELVPLKTRKSQIYHHGHLR